MIGQSLADPDGTNAIVGAVSWLQGTLLGSVAQVVAIIAVASIGFMMLAGRVNVRHGATVILGCFVIFGASTIAAGLRAVADGQDIGAERILAENAAPQPQYVPLLPTTNSTSYDPYAGASPMR